MVQYPTELARSWSEAASNNIMVRRRLQFLVLLYLCLSDLWCVSADSEPNPPRSSSDPEGPLPLSGVISLVGDHLIDIDTWRLTESSSESDNEIKVEVKIEEEAAEGPRWRASSRNERDNDDGRLVREDQDEDTLTSEDISLLSLARLTNGISHDEIFQESSKFHRSDSERNGRSIARDFSGPGFSEPQRDPNTGLMCVYQDVELPDGTRSEVQSLSREPLLECKHIDETTCHYTYVTKFQSVSEQVCEDIFEKKCQITFNQEARNETVKMCHRPMEIRCDGRVNDRRANDDEDTCRTVSESFCTTRYVKKGSGDNLVADTRCEKVPTKVCGRSKCRVAEGKEKCYEKNIATIMDVPQESCDLNPQEFCRHQSRLVPHLEPVEECKPQPKEVCTLNFSSPKLKPRPLKKKWCFEENNEVQSESKPQGQQPQYQRPREQQPQYKRPQEQQPQYQKPQRIQERPSRPSVPSSVSRRPPTRKPKTYLPSYKDVNSQAVYKPKSVKDTKFGRLSSARPSVPNRSTTARPLAHLNRGQSGRQAGTQPASASKTQLVRPSGPQSVKHSTPRPARPDRPLPSRKGTPLFSNPVQTIFGTIRTTLKPRRARTQLPSRRKPHATPRGQLARRPKFEESFSKKRPNDVVRNVPQKASLRNLPEEEEEAKEDGKEEKEKEEDTEDTPKESSKLQYDDAEGTTKESSDLQPEQDETEQISDLDDLPGYIIAFEGQDEGGNIVNQEDSSEENEELSVSYDLTLRESEEEEYRRDTFKDPDVSFGLFKPSSRFEEITTTNRPDIQEENAEPENPLYRDIFQPSNQDLKLPANAGFEASVAVPNAPVIPVPVSVSSLPRPEPELGPGGFAKLKQAIEFSIPTRSAFPRPTSRPRPYSFDPLPNPELTLLSTFNPLPKPKPEYTLLSTAKPPTVAAAPAVTFPAASAFSLGLPERVQPLGQPRPLPVVGRARATPRPRFPKSVSLEETTVKPSTLYTPRPYKFNGRGGIPQPSTSSLFRAFQNKRRSSKSYLDSYFDTVKKVLGF